MAKGKLYLLPTTLGQSAPEAVIPAGVLTKSRSLKLFIVENERTARRYLKSIGTEWPLDELQFSVLDKHTATEIWTPFIQPLLDGSDMGLLSEAGLPAIADPGSVIVARCHTMGIEVVPCSGPSSIILALIASGFNGQSFIFHGYLPIDQRERIKALRQMESESRRTGITQIFMETPFRNAKLFEQIVESCNPQTLICIATDITLDHEQIHTKTLADWKKRPPSLNKRPCIFLIGN